MSSNKTVPLNAPLLQTVPGQKTFIIEPLAGADLVEISSTGACQGSVKRESNGPPIAIVPAGGTVVLPVGERLYCEASPPGGTFSIQYLVFSSQTVPIEASMRPVAHNTGNGTNNQFSHISGQTAMLTRALWCFPQGAATIQPLYSGFEMPNAEGEPAIPNPLTITCAIELADGHIQSLTFNGLPTGTVTPGGFLKADPLAVDVAPGTWCWLRTLTQVSPGGLIPFTHNLAANTTTGIHEGDSYGATSVSQTVNDNFGYAYDAITILGVPQVSGKKSLAVVGDSIAVYGVEPNYLAGKYFHTASTPQGWPNRFTFQTVPLLSLARSGYSIQHYSDDNGLMRKTLLAYAEAVIFEMGVNDLSSGRTLAQIQADLQNAWMDAKALGLTVLQTTMLPNNNSGTTNVLNFVTGLGSTPGPTSIEPIRKALNAWIRTQPQFLDGVLDLESVIDPNQTGLWPIHPPLYTGTCGTGTTSSASTTLVDSGTPGWTGGQWANPPDALGPYIVMMTSGAAKGMQGVVLDNDGSTITVGGTAKSGSPIFPGIAVGDTYAIADPWTFEGLHPFPRTHARLANFAASTMKPYLG